MVRALFVINFNSAHEKSNVILALADLISQDDPSKPIVALYQVGSNNISELSISPEKKKSSVRRYK